MTWMLGELVKRARDHAYSAYDNDGDLMTALADRIEALEAVLQEISALQSPTSTEAYRYPALTLARVLTLVNATMMNGPATPETEE